MQPWLKWGIGIVIIIALFNNPAGLGHFVNEVVHSLTVFAESIHV